VYISYFSICCVRNLRPPFFKTACRQRLCFCSGAFPKPRPVPRNDSVEWR